MKVSGRVQIRGETGASSKPAEGEQWGGGVRSGQNSGNGGDAAGVSGVPEQPLRVVMTDPGLVSL